MDLEQIVHNLSILEGQIQSFEESLAQAKALKARLELQKLEAEEEQAKDEEVRRAKEEEMDRKQNESPTGPEIEVAVEEEEEEVFMEEEVVEEEFIDEENHNVEEEALRRRIAELRRQLEETQNDKQAKEEHYEESDDETFMEQVHLAQQKAIWTQPASEITVTKNPSPPPSVAPDCKTKSPSPADVSPPPDPIRASAKKFAWQKPAWARPDVHDDNDESGVITESLQNSRLRQAQGSGYVRQVQPKDLDFFRGNFVPAQAGIPDPRLAWIVIDMNGKKIGKIVMHLYGQAVDDIVKKFVDLKGAPLQVEPKKALLVLEREPKLYITANSPNGLHKKKDVYGVVQEGNEVVEQIRKAGDDAQIIVRQAHVYPVKKAKGT